MTTMKLSRLLLTLAAIALGGAAIGSTCLAASGQQCQSRIEADVAADRPVVVHLVVALCDNENQGIVRVAPHLGCRTHPFV